MKKLLWNEKRTGPQWSREMKNDITWRIFMYHMILLMCEDWEIWIISGLQVYDICMGIIFLWKVKPVKRIHSL